MLRVAKDAAQNKKDISLQIVVSATDMRLKFPAGIPIPGRSPNFGPTLNSTALLMPGSMSPPGSTNRNPLYPSQALGTSGRASPNPPSNYPLNMAGLALCQLNRGNQCSLILLKTYMTMNNHE